MAKQKFIQKFNPNGPENKFKGKLQEPDRFEQGSRNVMKVEPSGTAVLKVWTEIQPWMRTHPHRIPDIGYSTSFDIGDEGVSILIGRLNTVEGPLCVSDVVSLISDPKRVQAILSNRIEYVRDDITAEMKRMEKDKVLLETLKNPDPDKTPITWINAEQVERRMDFSHRSIQRNARKVELLKEVLSGSSLTHVLHVSGGITFSSAHAILSIKPGEITYIPLQEGGGTCIDAQNYGLGDEPPFDVKISIAFKK